MPLRTVSISATLVGGLPTVSVSADLVTGHPVQFEVSALLVPTEVPEETVEILAVHDAPPIILSGGIGAILYKGVDDELQWLEIPIDWTTKRYVLSIADGLPSWGITNDSSEVFAGWGFSWGTSWGF